MAGRYRRMLSRTKTHPYWQYVAIDDGQTRPAHARLRGKVFRFDDPIWDIIYPPNGWGCRCRVRALTEAQVKAMGITVENGEGYIQRFDTETVARGTGEVLTVPHARIDLPDGSSMSPDLGWAYSPGEAAFGTDVAVAKKLGTIQSLDTRAQFIQALNNSPLRHAQFAQWTDEVLAIKPGQKRRPGLGVQALGFMTPSIQAAVTGRLGREPSVLLAIRERELISHLTLQSASNKSLSREALTQLPLILAEPEAVLWDSENQHLLYVYPAIDGTEGNGSKDKVVINSAWQLMRQPNEGEVQLLMLSLAQLQQAQYQVLEGKLRG
ncbi:phage minor head protein [Shewanella sp. PP-Sp27a-2]